LGQRPSDFHLWLSKACEERLDALERMRREYKAVDPENWTVC
jgi:hypothetical protein